jgi:hypothetical protein
LTDIVSVIVAALIGYRVARLLTTDTLFEGTRDRIKTWAHVETVVLGVTETSYRWVELKGKQRKWLTVLRGKAVDLLVTCPYCNGFWASLAAWFLLTGTSVADATMTAWCLAVAASGLQSLLWRFVEDK